LACLIWQCRERERGKVRMRTEAMIFGFVALSSALILCGLFLMLPTP